MKREKPKAVRAVIKMNIEGKIGGERPKKKRWLDTIEKDPRAAGVCINNMKDRVK